MEDDRIQGIGKMSNQLVDKRTFYKQLRTHRRIGKHEYILFTLFVIIIWFNGLMLIVYYPLVVFGL